MVVELISQFYTEKRSFRIVGEDGSVSYMSVNGADEFSAAVFDIEVSAYKKNAYDAITHNELIMELYKSGAFNKENLESAKAALNAMILDNKQGVIRLLDEMKGEN